MVLRVYYTSMPSAGYPVLCTVAAESCSSPHSASIIVGEHINSFVRSTCISPYMYFMERLPYTGYYLTNQFVTMTCLFSHALNKWNKSIYID